MQKEDFKFSFEKDIFLVPSLLENELEKLESAEQKLEFVYDYIYNNTQKNRFALFKDSDKSQCKLYKDESKIPFSKLKFETPKEKPKQEIPKEIKEVKKPIGAVNLVKNKLCYKLGFAIIEHSKSVKGYFKMPFVLIKIAKEHKNLAKNNANLEDFSDYKEALKCKNHLSYKLGNALIKAHKTWYKGGYLKFYFDIKKIKKEFKKNNPKQP